MMRNLTAADLGLDIFCGAEPRRAETSHRPGTGGSLSADEGRAALDTQEALPVIRDRVNSATQTYERPDSAEMPNSPSLSQEAWNDCTEESVSDTYQEEMETQLEQERRAEIEEERNR